MGNAYQPTGNALGTSSERSGAGVDIRDARQAVFLQNAWSGGMYSQGRTLGLPFFSVAGFTAQGILAVAGGVSVWMVWCREPVKAVPAASRMFQVMATLWAGAKSGRCRVMVR